MRWHYFLLFGGHTDWRGGCWIESWRTRSHVRWVYLDEVDIHIQQNLEDEVVKAALESVINLQSSPNVFIFISPFYEG